MIVCVCHRISDRDIRRVAPSCSSFDDLQMDTGVSTCCGRCEDCAREVFTQAKVATGTVALMQEPHCQPKQAATSVK